MSSLLVRERVGLMISRFVMKPRQTKKVEPKPKQETWDMPQQCFCCDESVEGVRATVTFPAFPDFLGRNVPAELREKKALRLCLNHALDLWEFLGKVRRNFGRETVGIPSDNRDEIPF